MIKDYLYTIGKYLPFSIRDDVLKEIESNIYDYLEENYGLRDNYSNKEIEESILSLGDPKKVARAYLDRPRELIGPPLLDTYFLLLKIVIPALALGLIIANLLSYNEILNIKLVILNTIENIWSASLSLVGMMTIIFGLIYKYAPNKDLMDNRVWSINDLEKAPDLEEKVKLSDLIFEISFSIIVLILFNKELLFGESTKLIGILNKRIISENLILINLVLFSTLILNTILLGIKRWNNITRLLSIILDIGGMYIFKIIAFGDGVFDFTKISGISIQDANEISLATSLGLRIGFLALIIIVAIDTYKHIRIMLK